MPQSSLWTRQCNREDADRARRCGRRIGLPLGRVWNGEDAGRCGPIVGLLIGRVGGKAHGKELSEGASEEMPDVSTCGIEHHVGESVHIPRGRQQILRRVGCWGWWHPPREDVQLWRDKLYRRPGHEERFSAVWRLPWCSWYCAAVQRTIFAALRIILLINTSCVLCLFISNTLDIRYT